MRFLKFESFPQVSAGTLALLLGVALTNGNFSLETKFFLALFGNIYAILAFLGSLYLEQQQSEEWKKTW